MGSGQMRPPGLVGRVAELDAVRSALAGVAGGGGRVLLIEGEAGVGKTRLLDEAVAEARSRGFEVRRGAARELELDRPFGAIADALDLRPGATDPERAEIGRLLSGEPLQGLRSLTALVPELRFRVVEAIVALVERLAVSSPQVIAVDDLQWVDPPSALVLHELARQLTDVPLALVAAFRPVPRPDHLERALGGLREAGAVHLALAGLDGDAVAELVEALSGAAPSPELLGLVAGAGGNPFYISELVAALAQEVGPPDGSQPASGTPPLPPTLRLTVLRRLGALSRPTLEVLRVAAVLGSDFSPRDLATVMGRAGSDLLPPLGEALAAGVLTEEGERLAFRHDLVRESVYQDLPAALRRMLHLQAGRQLAAGGAGSIQVATQLALGAEPGDTEAITWLRRAAGEVASRAPATAAALLRRAADLADPAAGEGVAPTGTRSLAAEVRRELIWALLWSGKAEEAGQLARRELQRLDEPAARGMLRYVLAKGLVAQGRIRESLEELEAGLAEEGLPASVAARLLGDLALRRVHLRELAAGRAAAEQALQEAAESGSAFTTCAALAALTVVHLYAGETPEAGATVRRLVAVAAADPTGEAQLVGPDLYAAMQATEADRLEEAAVLLDAFQLSAQGQLFSPLAHTLRGISRFCAGAWDGAVADCETGLALAAELGSPVFDVAAHAVLAMVALERGDLPAAGAAVDAGRAELGGDVTRMGFPRLRWAEALLAEARGDRGRALALLQETWELLGSARAHGELPELAPDLVRLLLAAGDRAAAARVARELEDLGPRMGTPSASGRALLARGLVEADPDVLLEAVASYRSGPRRIEAARAGEDAGMGLAEAGRAEEALAALDEALRTYESAGALRAVSRVEAALRAQGVRRRRPARRRRATSGWESLTPTEEQVVRLTAQGLTNRQVGAQLFISPRTVATHLSHVFAKLGVATRAELAAAAARRSSEG